MAEAAFGEPVQADDAGAEEIETGDVGKGTAARGDQLPAPESTQNEAVLDGTAGEMQLEDSDNQNIEVKQMEEMQASEDQQPTEATDTAEGMESVVTGAESQLQNGEIQAPVESAEIGAAETMEQAVEEVEAEAELINKEFTLETVPTGREETEEGKSTQAVEEERVEEQALEDRTEDQVPDITGTDNADVMATSMDDIEEIPTSDELQHGAEAPALKEEAVKVPVEAEAKHMEGAVLADEATPAEAVPADKIAAATVESAPTDETATAAAAAVEAVTVEGEATQKVDEAKLVVEEQKQFAGAPETRAIDESKDQEVQNLEQAKSEANEATEEMEHTLANEEKQEVIDVQSSAVDGSSTVTEEESAKIGKEDEFEMEAPLTPNHMETVNVESLSAETNQASEEQPPEEKSKVQAVETVGFSEESTKIKKEAPLLPKKPTKGRKAHAAEQSSASPVPQSAIVEEQSETSQSGGSTRSPRMPSSKVEENSAATATPPANKEEFTFDEEKPSSRKTSAVEEKVLSRKTSEEEKIPSRKTSAIEEKVSSRKSSAAEEKIPSRKSSAAEEKIPSRKSSAAEEKIPSRKSSAAEEKIPSRKSSAAEEKIPSRKSSATGEKIPPRKSSAAEEKTPSRKSSAAEERVPSRKTSEAEEKIPSRKIFAAEEVMIPSRKASEVEEPFKKASMVGEERVPSRKSSAEIPSRKESAEVKEKVPLRKTSISTRFEEEAPESPPKSPRVPRSPRAGRTRATKAEAYAEKVEPEYEPTPEPETVTEEVTAGGGEAAPVTAIPVEEEHKEEVTEEAPPADAEEGVKVIPVADEGEEVEKYITEEKQKYPPTAEKFITSPPRRRSPSPVRKRRERSPSPLKRQGRPAPPAGTYTSYDQDTYRPKGPPPRMPSYTSFSSHLPVEKSTYSPLSPWVQDTAHKYRNEYTAISTYRPPSTYTSMFDDIVSSGPFASSLYSASRLLERSRSRSRELHNALRSKRSASNYYRYTSNYATPPIRTRDYSTPPLSYVRRAPSRSGSFISFMDYSGQKQYELARSSSRLSAYEGLSRASSRSNFEMFYDTGRLSRVDSYIRGMNRQVEQEFPSAYAKYRSSSRPYLQQEYTPVNGYRTYSNPSSLERSSSFFTKGYSYDVAPTVRSMYESRIVDLERSLSRERLARERMKAKYTTLSHKLEQACRQMDLLRTNSYSSIRGGTGTYSVYSHNYPYF